MATKLTRLYGGFRGVDFRGEEVNTMRSPDALNMWKDYRETERIRTRPALKERVKYNGAIYGIFFFKDEVIVHRDTYLYAFKTDYTSGKMIYNGVNAAKSYSFVYADTFYFKDGKNYLAYNGGDSAEDVEGYIPTTSIARKPAGGGTQLNDVNFLSSRRRNTFLADGTSVEYYVDSMSIDQDFVPIVTVDGKVLSTSEYTVDYTAGKIKFKTAPAAPLTDGQDTVVIEFKKEIPGYRETILNCTLLQIFDNRVFFSGNPDEPNKIWHCSLDDPSYCSDTDYYEEGFDTAAVRGMVAGNNALWVFREPSDENTTIFYHTPGLEGESKIYPSTHSSISAGCIGRAINFNDDIVFFSERGMEGISGDVTTEQVISHRSTLVDSRLLSEADYRNMLLAEWEGYLLVSIGSVMYLADSRGVYSNGNHFEYEWFYWDLGHQVTCVQVHDGILYIGTDDGRILTLTDTEGAVESYWTTPKEKFENPHRLKSTNKRGCVAEAEGDVSVFAKLEDTDFEHIGTYTGVTDYFVSRIKRKKFKDIQLKFHTDTRFSLEQITLEAYIGGYIKR